MFVISTVGYILIALLVFGFLIFIHEFGHFITARMFGVPIKEFALGMGPKIFSFKSKKYDTFYSLRLFPIGGYVSMVGEDEDSDDENALNNKPVWQRLIITAAGATMNLLLGVLIMTIIVTFFQAQLPSTTVGGFREDAVSNTCGLQIGDKITRVNDSKINIFSDLGYEIMMHGTAPIDLEVIRNGEKLVLEDVTFPTAESEGMMFGDVDFKVYPDTKNVFNVMKHSFYGSLSAVKMIFDSLIGLLTGRFGVEAVSGPVGVTGAIGEAAKSGIGDLLYLVVMISMNLGVFNLIPFPALDGGRIFFMLIELVRGKPVAPKYEGFVHFAGIVILLSFMVFITLKDIIKLFV